MATPGSITITTEGFWRLGMRVKISGQTPAIGVEALKTVKKFIGGAFTFSVVCVYAYCALVLAALLALMGAIKFVFEDMRTKNP